MIEYSLSLLRRHLSNYMKHTPMTAGENEAFLYERLCAQDQREN
jgi:hypothetical protein